MSTPSYACSPHASVIIYGTKDVSQLAKFYFENDASRKVLAFCEDAEFIQDESVLDVPVLSFEQIKNTISPNDCQFFVPLYDNKLRAKKAEFVKSHGYSLTSYVSSKATVWSPVGENCFVMEDNTIQPFVEIGDNVILWSGNHIGHHSRIKNSVFFSSHVVLSGNCTVEPYCWFGVNSAIRDSLTIAEGTFLAMSSMLTKNTKPYKKYMGSPAKPYGDMPQ